MYKIKVIHHTRLFYVLTLRICQFPLFFKYCQLMRLDRLGTARLVQFGDHECRVELIILLSLWCTTIISPHNAPSSVLSFTSFLLQIPTLHYMSTHLLVMNEKDKQWSIYTESIFTRKQRHVFYKYPYKSKGQYQFSHFTTEVIEDQRSEELHIITKRVRAKR